MVARPTPNKERQEAALAAVLILASSLLFFASAGAVMTDPALAMERETAERHAGTSSFNFQRLLNHHYLVGREFVEHCWKNHAVITSFGMDQPHPPTPPAAAGSSRA
ncbi:hypothetical protein D9M69_324650 [compost metagenome]